MPSKTKAWPTLAEFAHASNSMGGEGGAIDRVEHLYEAMIRLVDLDIAPSIVEDAEPATIETLGALTAALGSLRFDLEHSLGRVRTMELMRDAMAIDDTMVIEVEEVRSA